VVCKPTVSNRFQGAGKRLNCQGARGRAAGGSGRAPPFQQPPVPWTRECRNDLVLAESLAHVFSTGKSANDLANPPTGHGGFATPETFQLKEVLDDRRICQVGISDLANPRGPENMGERFDQDQN